MKKVYFVLLLIIMVGVLALVSFSTEDNTKSDIIFSGLKFKNAVSPVKIPERLNFAGEEVPLDNFDTKESLDRELLVNTYWHSSTMLLIKRANRYFPVIEPILAEYKVPDDFKYLAVAESGLSQARSPAGAIGFWQFLEGTARDYGLEVNNMVDERYHIEKSTTAACRYVLDSYKKFGNWTLVAASYNMGRRNVKEQILAQKETNYYDLLLGEETERYVFRLIALKMIISEPRKYGFVIEQEDLYPYISTYKVEIDSTVESFADFAHHHDINYKVLKLFNPWLRKPYLHNKQNKKYIIQIPENGIRDYENNENDTLLQSLK